MAPKSYTWGCTAGEQQCYVGNFNRTANTTAHNRLESAGHFTANVAGSIKSNGAVEARSISVNMTKHGRQDMGGTSIGQSAMAKISGGNYKNVPCRRDCS